MMRKKQCFSNGKGLWLIAMLVTLIVLSVDSKAQLSTPNNRDSTSTNGSLAVTRERFNSWDIEGQKDFLLTPGFIIIDIKNAQPYNYLNPPAEWQYYITEWTFYYDSDLEKQLDILHKPDVWIVFPDAQ